MSVPGAGPGAGYRPLATFDRLDDDSEAELFAELLDLAHRRPADCVSLRTFSVRAYCHSGPSAENPPAAFRSATIRRSRPRTQLEAIDALLASDAVDRHAHVVTSQLLTPFGAGLKALATYAGFTWRDNDPGGEQSLAWYELATAHPDQWARKRTSTACSTTTTTTAA